VRGHTLRPLRNTWPSLICTLVAVPWGASATTSPLTYSLPFATDVEMQWPLLQLRLLLLPPPPLLLLLLLWLWPEPDWLWLWLCQLPPCGIGGIGGIGIGCIGIGGIGIGGIGGIGICQAGCNASAGAAVIGALFLAVALPAAPLWHRWRGGWHLPVWLRGHTRRPLRNTWPFTALTLGAPWTFATHFPLT